MPVKSGSIASNDYNICKHEVEHLITGSTNTIIIDDYKRCQKYLYEIGLKMKPRREFSTKKLSFNELRVTRIC